LSPLVVLLRPLERFFFAAAAATATAATTIVICDRKDPA
jgi:hypothetical protein